MYITPKPWTYLKSMVEWAMDHKFWKTRIVSIGSLAKALSNTSEKSITAQYDRYHAAKARVAEQRRLKVVAGGDRSQQEYQNTEKYGSFANRNDAPVVS